MSRDDEIQNTCASASQQPLLPAGESMPKALIIAGNLAAEGIGRNSNEQGTTTR